MGRKAKTTAAVDVDLVEKRRAFCVNKPRRDLGSDFLVLV